MAPGGRVVVTVWEASQGEINQLWQAVTSVKGFEAPPARRLPPEEDFERSPEGLARLAEECGLEVASARRVSWDFVIEPRDLWQGLEHGIAGIGRAYLAQDEVVRERMRRAYDEAAAARTQDGLLHLRSHAVLVEAVVPAT